MLRTYLIVLIMLLDQKLEISKKSTFRLNLVPPRDSSIGDILYVTVDEI